MVITMSDSVMSWLDVETLHSYNMLCSLGQDEGQCKLESAVIGKQHFFLWCQVLMDRSLLSEWSFREFCLRWDKSATIFLACLKILEKNRSWIDGKLKLITSSAEKMICLSLSLSLAGEAHSRCWWSRWRLTQWWQYIGHHHWLGRLNPCSCHRKFIRCCIFLVRKLMFRFHLRCYVMMVSRREELHCPLWSHTDGEVNGHNH